MKSIAKRYIQELEATPAQLPEISELFTLLVSGLKKYALVVGLGLLSVALYTMLYIFNLELIEMAQSTHAGHKGLFFLPIFIALVFSFIHGTFTSHFWDVLGVKAKAA